jgi:hypothetical protein
VRASGHAKEGRELMWSSHRSGVLLDVSVDAPSMAKEQASKSR